MAVGDVSGEMFELASTNRARYAADLRIQILPLSLLILALVLIAGTAFFRSDFWLLGALFFAAGFLVVSSLHYLASKRVRTHLKTNRKSTHVKHLGTGTMSAAAGAFALLAVTGDFGTNLGDYKIFVAQLGFALMVAGGFWLVMAVHDMV